MLGLAVQSDEVTHKEKLSKGLSSSILSCPLRAGRAFQAIQKRFDPARKRERFRVFRVVQWCGLERVLLTGGGLCGFNLPPASKEGKPTLSTQISPVGRRRGKMNLKVSASNMKN